MPEEDVEILLNPDQLARTQALALAKDMVTKRTMGSGSTVNPDDLIKVAQWIMDGNGRARPIRAGGMVMPATMTFDPGGITVPRGGIRFPADGGPAVFDETEQDSEAPADEEATDPATIQPW